MPIVQEDIDPPGNVEDPTVVVLIDLWGAGQPIRGYHPNTGTTVAGVRTIYAVNGSWSVDLLSNEEIEPSGTTYRIRRVTGCDMHTSFISVPASGGPYEAFTIEEDPSNMVVPSALAAMNLQLREYMQQEGEVLSFDALSRVRAHIARSQQLSTAAQIAILGDSLTESYNPTKRGYRWIDRLAHRLNGRDGGKSMYVPIAANTFSSISAVDWPGGQIPWTFSDGAGTTALATHGADLHARIIDTGDFAELVFNGDLVSIAYTATTGGPAAAAVLFDGVAQTAIDAQNTPELPGRLAVYGTIGDYGRHTVRVTATAAPLLLEGAVVHDNGRWAFGLHFDSIETFAFGHAGFATSHFTTAANWDVSLARMCTNVSMIGIALGANDIGAAVAPGDYGSNLVTIMQRIDAAIVAEGGPLPTYLLIQMPGVTADMTRAAWNAAAEIGSDRVGLLDLDARIQLVDWTPLLSAGHPNDMGQLWIADQIADFIDVSDMRPPGRTDLVRIEAATLADSRLAWTEALTIAAGTSTNRSLITDNTTTGTLRERRHRVWLQPGTYQAIVEYVRNASQGDLEIILNGSSFGAFSTAGTLNSFATSSGGTVVTIDTPDWYPLVIRKPASPAGITQFSAVTLRKTT